MVQRGLALILTVALGVFLVPLVTEAQPAGKVPRIGVMSAGSAPSPDFADVLRRGLAELGWISTSEIAVSCVIEDKYVELAVRALHETFELAA